ncbi:MAG: replication factor C large subunit [Methanomassiliicoccaceae archaeon]|nr:replication factor C large subunit [Methanomassiliicoccaceae archaeon]
MAEDWTEKYRPAKLDDIVGNAQAVKKLREWAVSWNKGIPKKRAVVLIGTPGIGKTSSAIALANDMNWDIIEMNASDQRTASAVKAVALKASNFTSLGVDEDFNNKRKKLIVMDEADNLFGNADRGALPAINELIKSTKHPVVLIVNDLYALSKKSATVKSDTIQIKFEKPEKSEIVKALSKIAAAEDLKVSDDVLKRVADNSNQDMRAAVRDLEAISHGKKKLDISSAEILQERIPKKDIENVLKKMFRENDPIGARLLLNDVDIDPGTAMQHIDENLPYEFRESGDLVRGYEKLARADVYLGRVYRRQYYGFWSYANDMMTAGVASGKHSNKVSGGDFRFPLYLVKMNRSKSMRALKMSLCYKIACSLHTSTKRVEMDILGPLKEMALNDLLIRVALVREAGLEPEELGFLLDMKIDSEIVKVAVELGTQYRPVVRTESVFQEPEPEPPPSAKPVKPEKPVQEAGKKPKTSLFDY